MNFYADTSFLFSLYANDANSARADQWHAANAASFLFTEFHRVELRNALSLPVFQQRMTLADARATWTDVETDTQTGVLIPLSLLWPRVWREAESLAESQTPTLGTRTFDVLHVAVARVLGAVDFITFDMRQTSLARQAGLTNAHP